MQKESDPKLPSAAELADRLQNDLGDHLTITQEYRVLAEALAQFQRETLLAARNRIVAVIGKVSDQHDAEEKAACCCDFWQAEICHLFDQWVGRGREVNERGEAMNQQNELLSDVVICDTWRSAHTQDENCMNPVPAERCSECGQYAQVLFQNCWCFKCYLKWMRQHGQWPITGEDSDDTTSG